MHSRVMGESLDAGLVKAFGLHVITFNGGDVTKRLREASKKSRGQRCQIGKSIKR